MNTASRPISPPRAISPIIWRNSPASIRLRPCRDGRSGCASIPAASGSRSAGYSRAIRLGERILVSGTTATHGAGEVVCPGDAAGQTVYILDKIAASLSALGASLDDVIRTRIYLRDTAQWEGVSRVHGRYLGHIRPANTLVGAALVGDYEVEIEAEAVVAAG